MIEHICREFEQAWQGPKRPELVEFVQRLSGEQQEILFELLKQIDIRYRTHAGEFPVDEDYEEIASELSSRQLAVSQSGTHDSSTNGHSKESASIVLETRSIEDYRRWDVNILPKQFVGPYRLVKPLGTGGMGSVWLAEQETPVKRHVALKVIRPDIDYKGAIARFEAERQAIALMDHPNNARILEAGTTEFGSPYFAMELIHGVRLNKYCDANRLGIRERLKLMIPICRAIQHAHQKGILHRDLKHSNVLITDRDGVPVPKVIDFGLAKTLETQHQLTEKSLITEFGKVVGTLQYMSPEQAETGNMDVDTRSDIYSLGIMIYKLLTGTTPLGNEVVSNKSLPDILVEIREAPLKLPSARLTEAPDLERISQQRSATPQRLVQQVKGDLDWIVNKALEKDRSRRYQTANALAMDLERFLENNEVLARPPSRRYRLQKFVERNQRLVASFLLFTLLLFAGITGTSIGFNWALNERDRANEHADFATRMAQAARNSEMKARYAEQTAESRLKAIRLKSAWSDWQLGNSESAMKMLGNLGEFQTGWECRFLKAEFFSNKTTLFGHAARVTSSVVSPDGQYLITGSNDHSIKIWDMNSKDLLSTWRVDGEVADLCLSSDSRQLAVATRANLVLIYEFATGDLVRKYLIPGQDPSQVAFCDNDTRLAVGLANEDVIREMRALPREPAETPLLIYDLHSERDVPDAKLSSHWDKISGLLWVARQDALVSCSQDGTLRIWNYRDDNFDSSIKLSGHVGGINEIAVSPDGTRLASAGKDMTIRIWDLESRRLTSTFVGHEADVLCVAFSSDGKRIVSGSNDHKAKVWNSIGEVQLTCQGHFGAIRSVQFSKDHREIYTVSNDRQIHVWNSRIRPSTIQRRVHGDCIWDADVSIDNKWVVTASEDGYVGFTLVDGSCFGPRLVHPKPVLSLALSKESKFVVTGAADNRVRIWDTQTRELVRVLDGHEGYVWDVSFSNDYSRFGTASADRTVRIWDAHSQSLLGELRDHDGEVGSVRFSADDQHILTAGDDKKIRLWDARTFELIRELEGHENVIWRAIFSPDDQTIASSSYDGTIMLWDVASGAMLRKINAHQNQIAGLTFTSDGRRLISASDDQSIRIWEVATGIELFVLRDPDAWASVHVSFSHDGNKLVSCNASGWLTIRTAVEDFGKSDWILPQDAVQASIDGMLVATDPESTSDRLKTELAIARRWANCFPSYQLFTIIGICEYRLGNFPEAAEVLEEAMRLERAMYGEPDLRPFIEGYLGMACARSNRISRAAQVKQLFMEKCGDWKEDNMVANLKSNLLRVLAETNISR